MKLARWVGLVAVLATLLGAAAAHAQTGSIAGRVTDEPAARLDRWTPSGLV